MLLCAADAFGLQPKMVFLNTTTLPGKQLVFITVGQLLHRIGHSGANT
jgi:hypothetical protein